MKPGNKFARKLIEVLEDKGIEWRDYSGRGMFGEVCVGVSCGRTTSEGEVMEAIKRVPTSLSGLRTDSLGMGVIMYWPNATLIYNDEVVTKED